MHINVLKYCLGFYIHKARKVDEFDTKLLRHETAPSVSNKREAIPHGIKTNERIVKKERIIRSAVSDKLLL